MSNDQEGRIVNNKALQTTQDDILALNMGFVDHARVYKEMATAREADAHRLENLAHEIRQHADKRCKEQIEILKKEYAEAERLLADERVAEYARAQFYLQKGDGLIADAAALEKMATDIQSFISRPSGTHVAEKSSEQNGDQQSG